MTCLCQGIFSIVFSSLSTPVTLNPNKMTPVLWVCPSNHLTLLTWQLLQLQHMDRSWKMVAYPPSNHNHPPQLALGYECSLRDSPPRLRSHGYSRFRGDLSSDAHCPCLHWGRTCGCVQCVWFPAWKWLLRWLWKHKIMIINSIFIHFKDNENIILTQWTVCELCMNILPKITKKSNV